MLLQIPRELHTTILTYLRATDLSSLHQTCTTFSNPSLIRNVIHHFATVVYPPDLTRGYDTPEVNGDLMVLNSNANGDADGNGNTDGEGDGEGNTNNTNTIFNFNPTFEILRNMEMLIVARVLSRPEPPLSERRNGCFYVSKAWCKAALKWLDVQEEQRKERYKLKMEAAAEAEAQAQAEAEAHLHGHGNHNGRGKKKDKLGHNHGHGKGKGRKQKKKMKKQERKKNRKMSDTLPPWPNVNHDLVCEHGYLKQSCGTNSSSASSNNNNNSNSNNSNSNRNAPISPIASTAGNGGSRSARAKRRLMDKQAWKVLKKLYPEGVQLSTLEGECIQCTMEAEAKKRNQEMQKLKEKEERKKPLQNEHLRKFYKRARGGVPEHCLTTRTHSHAHSHSHAHAHAHSYTAALDEENISGRSLSSTFDGMSMNMNMNMNTAGLPLGKKGSFYNSTNKMSCPLAPGVYCVLPRSWCHKWRKYIKTGEGGRPCAPDTSVCLCDAHRLPLIPPHLESFLYGESSSLLGTSSDITMTAFNNTDGGIGETSPSISTLTSVTSVTTQVSAAATTRTTSSVSTNSLSNVVTIHDIAAPSLSRNTSVASASSSMSLPASPSLPVGFNPVDRRLGSNSGSNSTRSRSSQHHRSNYGIPSEGHTPTWSQQQRQRQQQESPVHSELDGQVISALRASGLSEAEIQLQRLAMIQIEEGQLQQQQGREENEIESQHQYHRYHHQDIGRNNNTAAMMSPEDIRANLNAKLDRENKVVVEILTDAEFVALEHWWPEIHSSYALKFAVVEEEHSKGTEIMWTTAPCRACDASGYCNHDVVVRNRSRNWINATTPKKKKK